MDDKYIPPAQPATRRGAAVAASPVPPTRINGNTVEPATSEESPPASVSSVLKQPTTREEVDRVARARVQHILTTIPWTHAVSRVLAPLFEQIETQCLDDFLKDLLDRAGCSGDPILDGMVRQYLIAEQRLHLLHAKAADAKTDAAVATYTTLTIKLMGELRRMGLAIKAYRTPAHRSTTVIHRVEQWNQAQGDQQVAYERSEAEGGSRRMQTVENKVGSKQNEQQAHESRFTFDPEKREARRRRQDQPAQAVGVDA